MTAAVALGKNPNAMPEFWYVADPERPEDVDAVAELEVRRDDPLRQLVGDDGRDGDHREREPLAARRRE